MRNRTNVFEKTARRKEFTESIKHIKYYYTLENHMVSFNLSVLNSFVRFTVLAVSI